MQHTSTTLYSLVFGFQTTYAYVVRPLTHSTVTHYYSPSSILTKHNLLLNTLEALLSNSKDEIDFY